mgnify:CR=1 FL=1|tara:strand:- start:434 stop:625 length:192 start_codon:yes stop_codon:yes gene_type:complete
MRFDEAVLIAMQKFRDGEVLSKTKELKEGAVMYTPQYFDDLEAETLGEEVEAPETEMEIEDEI